MNITSNFTHDWETSFSFKPSFTYPVAVFYIAVTAAVAIIGNLMVCYAILTDKNLRNNPSNLLLLSLAVADLLTEAIVMPFDTESLFLNFAWKHGRAVCLTWQLVYLFVVPVSIFSLLVIIIDRYQTLSDFHGRFGCSRFMTKTKSAYSDRDNLALQHFMGSSPCHGMEERRRLSWRWHLHVIIHKNLHHSQPLSEYHSSTPSIVRVFHSSISHNTKAREGSKQYRA